MQPHFAVKSYLRWENDYVATWCAAQGQTSVLESLRELRSRCAAQLAPPFDCGKSQFDKVIVPVYAIRTAVR